MKGYIAQQVIDQPRRLALVRYTGALLAVAVGVLLALWLRSFLDASVVLLMAILVAAWFSGFWPALLASALATLALDYFFTPPLYTFTPEIAHIPRLVVFSLISAVFVGISAARRRAERSLERARDDLDATVRERTAELTRANQRLSTQCAVTRKLADSDSLDDALPEVLRIIGTSMNWDWGALWQVDRDAQVLRSATVWCGPEVSAQGFAGNRDLVFGPGHGLPGQVWHSGQPRWIADVIQEPGFVRTASAALAGLHGATAFPIRLGNDTIGVIEGLSHAVRQPDPEELETLSALGSQIGQFIERRRAAGERERLLVREQAAHAEAAASQQRFRDLVNSIEGIVWEADARNSQFTFVSDQAERVLGYPVTQWLREPAFWKDHIHPEDRELAVNSRIAATTEQRDHDFEYRMLASDGRTVWLRDLVTVVVEDNQATKLRGVMFDITARKHAEQALRDQADLLNLTHDTIFVRDMQDVIRYWNRGAEELYGWTSQEAVGQVTHALMQTIFPAPLTAIDAEVLERGRWDGELVHTRRDGSQVVVASRWSLQRDADGRPIAILETNNDMTERKRAEDALRASEEQWRDVFENNPTMYFMVDAGGQVRAVNPFGAEMLGYSVDELVGQPVLSVFHESDREAVQENVEDCLRHVGRPDRWEARKVRKDGTVLWVRETAKAVLRASGPIVLIACEDMTAQRRAAEALRQAQADLAHVSRVTAMGELTASLAHEVKQPIAAAIIDANTCVRWLARDPPDIDEARAAALRAVEDGRRATEIIGRIRLLFTKGAAQREWIDVNDLIREMIVLLRSEATRYAISVRTALAADLPQVMGDRVQLQQVLMNLIMNSIDAMKAVEGTRDLAITSHRGERDQLLVSVTDTGVGLPSQQADEIFKAFFTTKDHGMGMGLSISQSIVEQHGGRLWAVPNDGPGTTFHFTLEAHPAGESREDLSPRAREEETRDAAE